MSYESREFKGYIVGVDLGQLRDFTALAVVERVGRPLDRTADTYHVVELEQLPLGAAYTDVARHVAELAEALRSEARARLELRDCPTDLVHVVLDGTGVGRPVVDLLREALWERGLVGVLSEVVFTSGLDATVRAMQAGGLRFTVPKADLIATLSVLLEQGRLRIAQELPLAPVLAEQLKALQRWLDPRTGRDMYGPPSEDAHDDLACALAVAVWWAERTGRPYGLLPARPRYRGL